MPVVDGDLAPPDSVIVDEVVVRVGWARLAGKPDGGAWKDLGLAHWMYSLVGGETSGPRAALREIRKAGALPGDLCSAWEPRIVPVGTGTLASPRQVAGTLHLAVSNPL